MEVDRIVEKNETEVDNEDKRKRERHDQAKPSAKKVYSRHLKRSQISQFCNKFCCFYFQPKMVSRKKKPGFDSEVLKETSYYFKNGEGFFGCLRIQLTFCQCGNLCKVCAMWSLTTSPSPHTPKVAGWAGLCTTSSQKSFKQRRPSTM